MWDTTYSPYQLCPGFCPGKDTPASHHIRNINAGKLMLSIQRLQKRGHDECIGKHSRHLVFRVCGSWLWHYFGSISQRQAWPISETARAASTVKLGASIDPQASEMRKLPVNGSSVFSTERDER